MPGFNPFRYRFPYTNLNDINLDWLIKKVRKLSEDVAEINPERMEEVAQQAAAAEQTAQEALETAEGVSGIATDAETIARAAQTTANNAADSAQAAGTAAAAAQTTANNAASSAQAAGTAAAAAQTTANNAANSAQAAGTAAAAAQTTADAAGTAAAAAQTTANQNRVALAIVANGNAAPQNISKGQYVLWYGGLYRASTAIASGAALSSSNLTAVSNGGLNQFLARSRDGRIVASGSVTIQLESDTNGIIIFVSANDSYKDIAVFRCTDTGNVSIKSLSNSSIVFSTATNELVITNTFALATLQYFIMSW